MGLLSLLLLLSPAPSRASSARSVQAAREAERALYDEEGIRVAILELELRAEEEIMSEEEHREAEEGLMERLAEALRRRQGVPPEGV